LFAGAAGAAAIVAALPVAAYAGMTLAVALDPDVRNGLGVRLADGLVSTSIAFVVLAPVVGTLGICIGVLVGVRSNVVRLSAPLGLMALLALPAALVVRDMSPEPGEARRLNEPVLAQIAPLAGASSGAVETVNESPEWESIDWVTRPDDLLPPATSASVAATYYRRALRSAGWRIEDVLDTGTRRVSIYGVRDGRRLRIVVEDTVTSRARLELR
jgi:hypothetical protein